MKQTRLKHVADVTLGKMLQSEAKPGDEICYYLKASSILEDGTISSNLQEMPFSPRERSNLTLLTGDTVVVEGGSIGRSAYISDNLEAIHFQNSINRVRPRGDHSGRYIRYSIESLRTAGYFEAVTHQATIRHLTAERLAEAPIPIHTGARQSSIADFLDHETAEIDALLGEIEQTLPLIAERWRTQLATSLQHPSPSAPLKRFGTLQTGVTLGADYPGEETTSYPYIRVANVQVGHVDVTELKEVAVPARVAESTTLQAGDILITEGGDRDKLGRGAKWLGSPIQTLHQNHVFAFRCNRRLDPDYLVYLLEGPEARRYFDVTARQSTNLASTNSSLLMSFPARIPPLTDQLETVRALDRLTEILDRERADLTRAIALAKERRAALITAAVTGQIDVTAKHRPAAEQLEDDIKELP